MVGKRRNDNPPPGDDEDIEPVWVTPGAEGEEDWGDEGEAPKRGAKPGRAARKDEPEEELDTDFDDFYEDEAAPPAAQARAPAQPESLDDDAYDMGDDAYDAPPETPARGRAQASVRDDDLGDDDAGYDDRYEEPAAAHDDDEDDDYRRRDRDAAEDDYDEGGYTIDQEPGDDADHEPAPVRKSGGMGGMMVGLIALLAVAGAGYVAYTQFGGTITAMISGSPATPGGDAAAVPAPIAADGSIAPAAVPAPVPATDMAPVPADIPAPIPSAPLAAAPAPAPTPVVPVPMEAISPPDVAPAPIPQPMAPVADQPLITSPVVSEGNAPELLAPSPVPQPLAPDLATSQSPVSVAPPVVAAPVPVPVPAPAQQVVETPVTIPPLVAPTSVVPAPAVPAPVVPAQAADAGISPALQAQLDQLQQQNMLLQKQIGALTSALEKTNDDLQEANAKAAIAAATAAAKPVQTAAATTRPSSSVSSGSTSRASRSRSDRARSRRTASRPQNENARYARPDEVPASMNAGTTLGGGGSIPQGAEGGSWYKLSGVARDAATVTSASSGQRTTIRTGDSLPGLGRVIDIRRGFSGWEVVAERGIVRE